MKKNFISALQTKKDQQKKISMLTAYDAVTARCLEESAIDVILVGDSVGNVFAGHETTLPVTLRDMIYHGKAVKRGAPNSIIVVDMPFMSYRTSIEKSKRNATKMMQETGANALKCEVNSPADVDTIKELIAVGIPIMAHIGLTPQFVEQFGGFKKQGKTANEQEQLLQLAIALEAVGVFSIVLEVIPEDLAAQITKALQIPTIGIGAGRQCDGQVLVINDVVGFSADKGPSFAKAYDDFYLRMKKAVLGFKEDVN